MYNVLQGRKVVHTLAMTIIFTRSQTVVVIVNLIYVCCDYLKDTLYIKKQQNLFQLILGISYMFSPPMCDECNILICIFLVYN